MDLTEPQQQILTLLREKGPIPYQELEHELIAGKEYLAFDLTILREQGLVGFGQIGSWAEGKWFNVAASLPQQTIRDIAEGAQVIR